MPEKFKSYDYIAIDLMYLDRDPVTIAVLPRGIPDINKWIEDHIKPTGGPVQHVGMYAYPVTLH